VNLSIQEDKGSMTMQDITCGMLNMEDITWEYSEYAGYHEGVY
jgi:hypothetical protein